MDYFLSSSINFLRFIFFSGILPPEVKKMLCGDYGNNNDQENCLLKKINEDSGNVRLLALFMCLLVSKKKNIF